MSTLSSRVTFVSGFLLLVPACIGVPGNGRRTVEDRAVPGFSSVSTDGSLDVQIRRADTTSVAVSIDSNLQHLVQTRVADDTLFIDLDENVWDVVSGPHVLVTMPVLRSARVQGSGSLSAESFPQDVPVDLGLDGSGNLLFDGQVPAVKARLTGSGDMRLRGSAAAVDLGLDGSGDLRAADLSAATGDLWLGGSGSLAATVTGPVRVTLDGSGDIDLFGGGALERSSLSGSGDLRVH